MNSGKCPPTSGSAGINYFFKKLENEIQPELIAVPLLGLTDTPNPQNLVHSSEDQTKK